MWRRTSDGLTLAAVLMTPPLATGLAVWLLPMTLPACESDAIQRPVSITAWVLGAVLALTFNLGASYWALGSSSGRTRQLFVLGWGVLVTTAGFALLLHATAYSPSLC